MKKKLIVAAAVLAIGFGAASALMQRAAPEVRFATLSGEPLSTSSLRGKVLLVNFWATSCASCVQEMPKLAAAYRKFAPRGYEMVAVAMSYDHPNRAAEFAQKRALPFKVALDGDGSIARDFGGVRTTPTSFLIGRKGRILKRYLGEPDWAEFYTLVEQALNDPT
jgi:peroxiredoxin